MRIKKLTQTIEYKVVKEYNFPRVGDQYEYSPDRSYSSLDGNIYDLNTQTQPIHRRVLSQAIFQRSKENKLSSLSPLKVNALSAMKTKLTQQRFFLLNQVQNKSKISHKTPIKKSYRLHTDIIENIGKYRLG